MSANGKLADSELALIPGTTKRVRADLAPQVGAWRAAFARRFGKPMSITDAYRPYWLQEQIFRERYTTSFLWGRPTKWWNWRLWYQRPGTAMAATPGTSNHGLGNALDLGSGINSRYTDEHAWAVETAPTYGFVWPSWWARGAGEWWHFEAVRVVPVSNPVVAPPGFVVGPFPTMPTHPTTEDDDMLSNEALTQVRGVFRDELLKVLRAPEFELQKAKRTPVADLAAAVWAFVTTSGATADATLAASAKESRLAADRATQIRTALTVETEEPGVFVARTPVDPEIHITPHMPPLTPPAV